MSHAPSHRTVDLLAAAALSAATVITARAWGFVGISNDDAARALLAWDFARAPSLDATRSSWLPAQSWTVGALMSLWRSPLHAPYALSWAATAAATALAVRAAVLHGASRGAAWCVALALLGWRWSVWTAAAGCVPEMPTAALLLGAVVALGRGRELLAGALAALACGHRYEAWFALAGLAASRAWELPDARALRFAAMGAAMPVAWLCMNHARSGDALDFVHRVEAFRATQGAPSPGVLRYPLALLTELPHVVVLAAVGAWAARGADRALWGACAVLVGLVVGDARGGGPTHHPERALVAAAWLLAPAAARGLDALLLRWRGSLAMVAVCVAVRLPRPSEARRFVDPGALLAGDAVRALRGPWSLEGERQDHLWVMLRSGRPEEARRDRAWGGPAPTMEQRGRWAEGAPVAVASARFTQDLLRRKGFVDVTGTSSWRVLRRLAASPR